MTLTQTKTEYLTEAMIEQVNDLWKVNSIESGRSFYSRLTYKVAKKYIKVLQGRVNPDGSYETCLLYTSPSPRDATLSRMPSSA